MKPLFCILIISSFFLGCDKRTENFLSINVPVTDISDSVSTITLPDDVILNPTAILNIGDYIVILNHDTEYILTIYNTVNHQLQYLQRIGRGPEELLHVNQIGIYPDSTNMSFYVYDDLKNALFIYRLSQDYFKLYRIEETGKYNFVALDFDMIVGIPAVDSSRYIIEKPRTNFVKFGDYSEYEFSEKLIDNTLSAGYMVTNEYSFAWFSLYGESYNIFNYQGFDSPKEIKKVYYTKPAFNQDVFRNQHMVILFVETILGFTSLTSSKEYIYALYSGKTLKDFMSIREAALAGNNIGVFDWNGNYVKRLYSKDPIVCINYNNKDKKLYALKLNQDMEYEIISILCDNNLIDYD